jgi:Methane oxygenase PmoA
MRCRTFAGLLVLLIAVTYAHADANVQVKENKDGGITITRPTLDKPILVFNAPEAGRPYLHPLLAPDGKGELTELSPAHHKHQTGIFVGFLKVNGRDFFHNRDGDLFRRTGFAHKTSSEGVVWNSTYELLDANKSPLLVETQTWTFRDFTKTYLIDLTWSAKASADVTFDKYDYGGLFVRMPWKGQAGAMAINSEGQENGKAEGQKARWVDVGMSVEGRKDAGHIAILAKDETPWRVDDQLGVGPAPSRSGAWKLLKGETATIRYRFYVYTGAFRQNEVEAQWSAFGEARPGST